MKLYNFIQSSFRAQVFQILLVSLLPITVLSQSFVEIVKIGNIRDTVGLNNFTKILFSNTEMQITRPDRTVRLSDIYALLFHDTTLSLDALCPNAAQCTFIGATASTTDPLYPVINTYDGQTGTKWTASSGSMPQTVIMNLGAIKNICQIRTIFIAYASRYYEYNIEVSPDGLSYAPVVNSKRSSGVSEWNDDTFFEIGAQYIKLNITLCSMGGYAQVSEMEVYGRDINTAPELLSVSDKIQVYRVSPNPFSGTTEISFGIPRGLTRQARKIEVGLYDIRGRLVKVLMDKEAEEGLNTVSFSSRSTETNALINGIYFIRIQGQGFQTNSKIAHIR